MEKYAWRGKIVPGMQEEYKKRHDNIWPEMKEVLADAGIVNYSIWMQGEELFGYYECEKGVEYAAKVQAESNVVKKWWMMSFIVCSSLCLPLSLPCSPLPSLLCFPRVAGRRGRVVLGCIPHVGGFQGRLHGL